MLGDRGVVLVLHLEHDGDDLVTGLVALAEDEVAIGAVGSVVVLLEVGMRERRGAQLIELSLAVLLEGLAHHLGGQAGLHVAQTLDLLVLVADEVLSALTGLLDLERMGGLDLRVSPTILVDRRAFMSRRRSISSSL